MAIFKFLGIQPTEKWFNILHDILTNLVQRQSGYCFKKRFIFQKNYRGIIRDLLRLTVNSMFCTKLKIRIYYSSRFSQAGRLNRLFLSWNNRHVSNYDVVLFILIFLSDARCVLFLLSQRTFLPRNWQNYDLEHDVILPKLRLPISRIS